MTERFKVAHISTIIVQMASLDIFYGLAYLVPLAGLWQKRLFIFNVFKTKQNKSQSLDQCLTFVSEMLTNLPFRGRHLCDNATLP